MKPKWLVSIALLMMVFVAAAGAVIKGRQALMERRLELVRTDFKEIFKSTASYGLDRCGVNYPPDTGVRRREDPSWPLTFETDHVYHQNHAYTEKKNTGNQAQSCTLTTPVAYIKTVPCDPFQGRGRFYGYIACDPYPDGCRPLAVLRSVGPDGREDLPLDKIKETLEACMRQDRKRTLHWTAMPDFRLWVRSQIDPYLYDPTNGTASCGDLVMILDRCSRCYGWGGRDALWAEAVPGSVPIDFNPLVKPSLGMGTTGNGNAPDWTQARFIIPEALTRVVEVSGIVVENGELRAQRAEGGLVPAQDRLNRLRNHLGRFGSFFQNPGALNPGEQERLRQWRVEDPAWWMAVETVMVQDPESKESVRLGDFMDLMVLYGKSKLLLAADYLAAGEENKARNNIFQMQFLTSAYLKGVSLNDAELPTHEALARIPYFARIHDELSRLTRELGVIANCPQ